MDPGEAGPALERLPGVLAATLFTDANHRTRVYLAVRPDVDHNAIRATALSMLRSRGIASDPDHLYIGTAPTHPPTPRALPGLALETLDVHRSGNRVECSVRLRAETRSPEGTASEPDSAGGRARAAARATLNAVETLDPDLRLGLHGARSQLIFGFEVLSVLIEVSLGRTHTQLPGAAMVDRSPEHAAVTATLQALRSWEP